MYREFAKNNLFLCLLCDGKKLIIFWGQRGFRLQYFSKVSIQWPTTTGYTFAQIESKVTIYFSF